MKSKIDYLLRQDYSTIDSVVGSHILNHICVLVSGYLEKELQNILENYKQSSHCTTHECKKNIQSMRNIQNAKWCSIRPIFTNIDKSIVQKMNRLKNFDLIISSVDNIVRTRHKVAHGENVTNLTIVILKDDFRNIQKFLKQLNKYFTEL
jgi:hypothetical protein